ncbi:oxidoreductase [Amylibacter marinus]|uniref:Oxidoreductase n=1 Tax=Amylibacter marinus TaxID=1475483 RepID=A0ABQ5VRC9_9RHOB|nr:SDR family NAD(P)-dependent oxidoreductase [Amylibacter marinus]GLQ33894.1 oxidoreductase [Amylibacter marinus]
MAEQGDNLALITGASRGLGAALAVEIAKKDIHVIAVARTVGALEEIDDLIQAAGGTATLVPMDITDEEAQKRLCISIHERWGGLDIWAHCAIHAAPLAPASHIADSDWQKTITQNITATGRLITNIEPLLTARKGTAVHMIDKNAGQKFFGAYGTSKAAQDALFSSWAKESESTGPRIIGFTPEPMPTATRARFYPGEDRAALNSCESQAQRLVGLLA